MTSITSIPSSTSGATEPGRRRPAFAAVAYLNMLPFFADDSDVALYPSPRMLNTSAPLCDAYCSSLIAGLAAHSRPLSNHIGVFASGRVLSVFIEPVIHSEAHRIFWKQLEELWEHRHPDPVGALKHSDVHGRVVVRGSGASEQSVWMLKVLMALAGFSVDVRIEGAPDSSVDVGEKQPPEAYLWIGDPALERRLSHPDAYRIDVGHIWTSHTGHKAWFAGWFTSAHTQLDSHAATTAELLQRASHWKTRSEFSRWCSIHAFLEKHSPALLRASSPGLPVQIASSADEQLWELRAALNDYFAALEFVVDESEGHELVNFYVSLKAAFESWYGRNQTRVVPEHATNNAMVSGTLYTHGNMNQSNPG